MIRPRKLSPSPVSAPSVHERIAAAEKALLQGATERVIVSDSDLETIAGLITDTGSTKAQILKKACHLGLQVLKMGNPVEATTAIHEEPFETEWAKPDPIPYAGFAYELRRPPGRHEPAPEEYLTVEAGQKPKSAGRHEIVADDLIANGDGGFVSNPDIGAIRNLEDLETQF